MCPGAVGQGAAQARLAAGGCGVRGGSEAGLGVRAELCLAVERGWPQGQAAALGVSHPGGGPRPCLVWDRQGPTLCECLFSR